MADYEKIAKKMLIKEPFYGLLLMSLNKQTTEDDEVIETAGVYKQGLGYGIMINTKWFGGLTEEEGIAVCKHEAMHIFLGHLTTFDDMFPNHQLANISNDLVINQMLDGLPEDVITYEGMSQRYPGIQPNEGSLYYYKYILAHQPLNNNGGGNGSGEGEGNEFTGQGGSEGLGKNAGSHKHWKDFEDLSDAEKELIEEAANGILKHAAEQCEKMRGTIPGEFKEKIDELFAVKKEVFNWKAYFRRLLGTAVEYWLKSTRKKPSKRFDDAPGFKHKHKHNILVAMDTSGSVSNEELQDFFSEIYHVWKAGAHVDVLEYDAKVNRVWEYKGKLPEAVTGRGGTDWKRSAYEWWFPRRRNYSAFITFTDGYDDYNVTSKIPNAIFIVTSNGDKNNEYPGKVIFIPGNNE